MANKILQIDLFENYKKQPTELKKIVNKYSRLYESGDMDYNDTKKFLKDVNSIGYTFDYGLDNMPYGLRPIGVKIYELKGFENVEEEEFAGGGGVKKQNPPQSKSYTKKNDIQAGKAKPVGKRYTDKLAKKLGKSPNAEPTQKDINKYLGKGVYDEKRKDKSDISLRKRFDIGGIIESIPSNSDIFLVVDNSGSTSNYLNPKTDDRLNEIVSNFRRIFPDIKVLTSESYGRIVEIYSQIPEGGGGFDIKSFIDWIEMYEKDEWSALDDNINNKYIIILTDGYEDFDVDFPNNTIILTTEEGKKIIEKNYPNISANITTLEDTNMYANGGGVGDALFSKQNLPKYFEKKVLRYRNKLVQMNVGKNEPSLDFAIKIIDMLVDGELVFSTIIRNYQKKNIKKNYSYTKDKEKQDQKYLKSILRHRNKLVQINVGKNEPSLDFAIKIIDMLVDGELIVKYANGGGVGSFEQYKNKIYRELLSLGLDKEDAKFVISFKGNQKYISDMYVGEKNYKSTAKELYEQSSFQVGDKPKYANGGGVGDFGGDLKVGDIVSTPKFNNGKIIKINTFNEDEQIQGKLLKKGEGLFIVQNLDIDNESDLYWFFSNELTKKSGEISKNQLENMVGKKLDGWNDDIVYYGGKKYQKCYLRPYYKVC